MSKKKLVELIIDQFSEKFGVQAISLVELPAIEADWVYLSNDNYLSLAKVDEEKRILVGAVLIPDKKIPRYDADAGEEYEVYFTSETIEQAEQLFMKNLNGNNATYEHSVDIQGLSVIESWISEDEKFDKSNMYGFKMPVGTWFVKMKVDNQEVWDKIKSNEVRGFSIEGYFVDRIEQMNKEIIPLTEDCDDCLDQYTLGKIGELLLEELRPIAELDGEPLFKTKQEAELYAETIKGCKGYHEHSIDGVRLFMPCKDHKTSTMDRYVEDEFGEKKKMKKKKYKMLKYISFIKRQALKRYDWNECIRDMKRKFGQQTQGKEGICKDKPLAECMCRAMNNR